MKGKGKIMEKKTNKNSLILAGAGMVHAAALLLIVKVIAPVCTGMVETAAGKQIPMKCHYTSAALVFLAVILLVNAVMCAVRKEMTVFGAIAATASVLAILTLNSSVGIGICMNPEMACNFTAPFVKVLGAAGVVLGVIAVCLGVKETK